MRSAVFRCGKQNLLLAGAALLGLMLSIPSPSFSAQSGAAFLKIPVGARAIAMGGAYTAVANDVTALHWNPAGLSRLSKKELGVMHAELFADTRYDFAGLAMPLGKGDQIVGSRSLRSPIVEQGSSLSRPWAMGLSAVYLSQGELEGRDEQGRKTSNFTASDLGMTLGLSRVVTRRSSLGASVKMIRQSIEASQASGFAVDLGLVTRTPKLDLGLSVMNLGPSMKFESESFSLPMTVAAGAAYRVGGSLMLAADVKHRPSDSVSTFGFGSELQLVSAFALRAGYLSSLSAAQSAGVAKTGLTDQISGLAAGFGIKLLGSQIDYALTPMGELGTAQRLSLTVRF